RAETMTTEPQIADSRAVAVAERLAGRPLVLGGLMGAGKTAIGRRVAAVLGLPVIDSDHEIEAASRMSIPELFEKYGETEFRALEQRVRARLIGEGVRVLATGGGAFMNAETRAAVREHALSIWLKADLDTLMGRVMKKQNRPLLKSDDPRAVMERLMAIRYPVYAEADITVQTRDERREVIADEVIAAVDRFLTCEQAARKHG